MITKSFSEEVDAALVYRTGLHADPHGNIRFVRQMQLFQGNIRYPLIIQIAAIGVDLPALQDAILSGGRQPPFRRKPVCLRQ